MIKLIDMKNISISLIIFVVTILFFSNLTLAASARLPSTSTPANAKEKPLVDIDIGGSSGVYNTRSYTEANLGVNLNFTEWLTWRNAGFKRFNSGGDKDMQGVDSTLRLNVTSKFENGAALRFFAGPGYRWADPSEKNAVVGEAGLGISVGRVGVTGGAKYLKYDKVQTDSKTGLETKREDINYFLTLSGGAGLSF